MICLKFSLFPHSPKMKSKIIGVFVLFFGWEGHKKTLLQTPFPFLEIRGFFMTPCLFLCFSSIFCVLFVVLNLLHFFDNIQPPILKPQQEEVENEPLG